MPAIRRVATKPREYAPPTEEETSEEEETREPRIDTVRSGWGARKEMATGGDFPDRLKLSDEPTLIKFLEDEPYAVFRQHWLDEIAAKRKSYTCIEDDCPLCAIGDKPKLQVGFNVAALVKGKWVHHTYTAATMASEMWEGKATGPHGPLPKHFWAAVMTGKTKQTKQTTADVVRERDLEEEWGITPPSPEDIAKVAEKCVDKSSVPKSTRTQLQDLADELNGD